MFFLGITVLAAAPLPAQESPLQTVEPADHGRALINPQMGWTMHFYSNIITNYGSSKRKNAWGDGTPVIALPHENDDGHRRYKLGTIRLLPSN